MSANPLPFHCERHYKYFSTCDACNKAKAVYWREKFGKTDPASVKPSPTLSVVHEAPATDSKPMATVAKDTDPAKVVPIAIARLTDPAPSHLAAAKIPTKKLWERMLIIRKLVLDYPGQCIRWYTNVLAEQTPAPELDAPGCCDSVGAPKHDVGFYGIWATLFAQAEKHRLIIKVTDPQMPTEQLMQRSPYPGESMVHVYEACTPANMERMEAERKAYFERLETKKTADREAKAAAVAERRFGKKVAKSVRYEIEASLGTDAGQSGSWFQTI